MPDLQRGEWDSKKMLKGKIGFQGEGKFRKTFSTFPPSTNTSENSNYSKNFKPLQYILFCVQLG